METPKMVVFVVERYAVREAKNMAVRSTQGQNKAVRSTQGRNRAVCNTQGQNRAVRNTQGQNRAVRSTQGGGDVTLIQMSVTKILGRYFWMNYFRSY